MALGDIIARLAVSLEMDTVAFEKGATLIEKRHARMTKSFEKFGKKMTGIGKTMSLALTAPLAAFGYSAVNAASDAAELQSAFGQTFGKMTDDMNKWAEDTGNAMGRSTQEMQKAANTFGIFFNTAVDPAKAAEMSKTFSELAQDLGSFFNVDTETAIQKLRSGLSGESEPLRDFGVFLTEANVKAKALELGLTGVGNELTEQEKILARYHLVMEATATAQGDVARTSDGTANKMRAAKAQFEELQVTVGEKLLPVVNKFLGIAEKMLNFFNKLSPEMQTAIVVAAGVAAVLGPVLIVMGSLVTVGAPLMAFLVTLAPALGLVGKALLLIALNPAILGLALVIGGIYLAWKNWDKIGPILQNLYTAAKKWIVDKLVPVINAVLFPIDTVRRAFAGLYNSVVGNSYIPDMVDGIAAEMARLDAVMVAPVVKATSKAQEAFRDMAREARSIMERLFPEAAAQIRYETERAALVGAGASERALRALANERDLSRQSGRPNFDFLDVGPIADTDQALRNLGATMDSLAKKGKAATVQIVDSFKDMAEKTLQSLDRLASAIRGGGFLDILGAVIGLGLQLGSAGLFGSKIAGRINTPAYAGGTNFHPGGLALVGERGPELVSMPRGSKVYPNGSGPTQRVEIVDTTGLFRFAVNGQIIEAAPQIAQGGAMMAGAQSARSKKWSLA